MSAWLFTILRNHFRSEFPSAAVKSKTATAITSIA